MGAGRLVALLSWVLALSGPTFRGGFWVEVQALHLVQDSGAGAWSPSLDEDLDPLTGVEWVGLVSA